jgi:ATP-binding protein involved in chromosome partitioning
MSYLQLADGTKVDVFGKGGGEQLARDTGTPFIGAIPMDPSVREGGDSGEPIVISNPESEAAKALEMIAGEVAAKVSIAAMQQENLIPIEFVD